MSAKEDRTEKSKRAREDRSETMIEEKVKSKKMIEERNTGKEGGERTEGERRGEGVKGATTGGSSGGTSGAGRGEGEKRVGKIGAEEKEREKVLRMLMEMKAKCSREILKIKNEHKKKRRRIDDEEEYRRLIVEYNRDVGDQVDAATREVAAKEHMHQDEFEALLRKHQDDEVRTILNGMCIPDMYVSRV